MALRKAANWEWAHLANEVAQRKWEEGEKAKASSASLDAFFSSPKGILILDLLCSAVFRWMAGPWPVLAVQAISLYAMYKVMVQFLYQGGSERAISPGTIEVVALNLWRNISETLGRRPAGHGKVAFILAYRIIWSCIKLLCRLVAGVCHAACRPIEYLWPSSTSEELLWRRLFKRVRILDKHCDAISSLSARSIKYADANWSEFCQDRRRHYSCLLNSLPTLEDLSDAIDHTRVLHERLSKAGPMKCPLTLALFVDTVRNKLWVLNQDIEPYQEYNSALQNGIVVLDALQARTAWLKWVPPKVFKIKQGQISGDTNPSPRRIRLRRWIYLRGLMSREQFCARRPSFRVLKRPHRSVMKYVVSTDDWIRLRPQVLRILISAVHDHNRRERVRKSRAVSADARGSASSK